MEIFEIGETHPVSHGIPEVSRKTLVSGMSKSPHFMRGPRVLHLSLVGARHEQRFLGFHGHRFDPSASFMVILCFSAQQRPFLTPLMAHLLSLV